MPLIKAVCTNCGANLEMESSAKAVCPYCGTPFVKEESNTNYNINNTNYIQNANFISKSEMQITLEAAEGYEKIGEAVNARLEYFKIIEKYPQEFRGWCGIARTYVAELRTGNTRNFVLADYNRAVKNAQKLGNDSQQKEIEKVISDYNGFYRDIRKKHTKDFGGLDALIEYLLKHRMVLKGNAVGNNGKELSMGFSLKATQEKTLVLEIRFNNSFEVQEFEIVTFDDDNCEIKIKHEGTQWEESKKSDYVPVFNGNIFLSEYYEDKEKRDLVVSMEWITSIEETIKIELISCREYGCYIATCVYGSYDCPQVWALRRYRDYYLRKNTFGRAFIRCYYAISPKLVKIFGKQNWFRAIFKGYLDKKVEALRNAGYEDTPYED